MASEKAKIAFLFTKVGLAGADMGPAKRAKADELGLKVIGEDDNTVTVPGDAVGTFRLLLQAPGKSLTDAATPIRVTIEDQTTHETSSHDAIFRGPEK